MKPRKVTNLAHCKLRYNQEVTGYPAVFSLIVSDQYTIFLQPPDEAQLVDWILQIKVYNDYNDIIRHKQDHITAL